jgi:hypothetical protein
MGFGVAAVIAAASMGAPAAQATPTGRDDGAVLRLTEAPASLAVPADGRVDGYGFAGSVLGVATARTVDGQPAGQGRQWWVLAMRWQVTAVNPPASVSIAIVADGQSVSLPLPAGAATSPGHRTPLLGRVRADRRARRDRPGHLPRLHPVVLTHPPAPDWAGPARAIPLPRPVAHRCPGRPHRHPHDPRLRRRPRRRPRHRPAGDHRHRLRSDRPQRHPTPRGRGMAHPDHLEQQQPERPHRLLQRPDRRPRHPHCARPGGDRRHHHPGRRARQRRLRRVPRPLRLPRCGNDHRRHPHHHS